MSTKRTLDDLRGMTDAMISNPLAAEASGINPERLHEYGKRHELPWFTFVVGNRVYHSREQLIECIGGRAQA